MTKAHHVSKKSIGSKDKMIKNAKQKCKVCGWRNTGSVHDICVHCNKTITTNQGIGKLKEITQKLGIKGAPK